MDSRRQTGRLLNLHIENSHGNGLWFVLTSSIELFLVEILKTLSGRFCLSPFFFVCLSVSRTHISSVHLIHARSHVNKRRKNIGSLILSFLLNTGVSGEPPEQRIRPQKRSLLVQGPRQIKCPSTLSGKTQGDQTPVPAHYSLLIT